MSSAICELIPHWNSLKCVILYFMFIICVYLCLIVCVCVCTRLQVFMEARGGHLIPLDMALQVGVSHTMWMLINKFLCSQGARSSFITVALSFPSLSVGIFVLHQINESEDCLPYLLAICMPLLPLLPLPSSTQGLTRQRRLP